MPDGLAAFIAERLSEDRTAAQAVLDAAKLFPGEPSRQTPSGHQAFDGSGIVTMYGHTVVLPSDVATHIALHDPARTLRAIAAKRAILAEHPVTGHGGHLMCDRCVNPYDPAGDELHRWVRYPCPTVRHLGTEWADHPAYQPEWSPEPAGYDALKRSVATLEAQVAILMNIALGKGDTSINTVRATLGLPAFPEDP